MPRFIKRVDENVYESMEYPSGKEDRKKGEKMTRTVKKEDRKKGGKTTRTVKNERGGDPAVTDFLITDGAGLEFSNQEVAQALVRLPVSPISAHGRDEHDV